MMTDETPPALPDNVRPLPGRRPPRPSPGPSAQELLRMLIERVDSARIESREQHRMQMDVARELAEQLNAHSHALMWLHLAAKNGTAAADAHMEFGGTTDG